MLYEPEVHILHYYCLSGDSPKQTHEVTKGAPIFRQLHIDGQELESLQMHELHYHIANYGCYMHVTFRICLILDLWRDLEEKIK